MAFSVIVGQHAFKSRFAPLMAPSPIRIKIVDRARSGKAWLRQLPESGSFTGKCTFVMDRKATDYDWLVVVDDVNRRLNSPPEILHCAPEHTLLTTTEPQSITRYSSHFSRQFAHVLTSQAPEELPHPGDSTATTSEYGSMRSPTVTELVT